MSLTQLAANLISAAGKGSVSIQAATLTDAGLSPAPDFDALLRGSFQLSAVPLKVTTSPGKIGTPTATQLTMTGSMQAWKVSVDPVTITFTVSGTHVVMTLSAPLPNWSFATSFPPMSGFPFDELDLTSSTFVFASDPVPDYEWQGSTTGLLAGLNFAADAAIAGPFGPLMTLLPAAPSGSLPLSGPVDPSVIDGTKIGMPNSTLTASLFTGKLPKLGFLQLRDADFTIAVTTEQTPSGMAQYTAAVLATKLDFGASQPVLDCEVGMSAGSDVLSLLLNPDPQAAAPSLQALFDVMGGQSWYALLPAPLQSFFTTFGFKGFQAEIDAGGSVPALQSVALTVGSLQPWTIFGSWTIEELDFGWQIFDPLGTPQLSGQLGGLVTSMSLFEGGIYLSITTDLQITASYQGSLQLSRVLSELAGSNVDLPAHLDLELTELDLMIDAPRKAVSFYLAGDAQLDVLGNGAVTMGMIEVSVAYVAGQGKAAGSTSASLRGAVLLGSTALDVDVEYTDGNWHFDGGLTPGSTVDLGGLIDGIFASVGLPDFLPRSLSVAPLRFTADVSDAGSAYTAQAGLSWTLTDAGVLTGTTIAAGSSWTTRAPPCPPTAAPFPAR